MSYDTILFDLDGTLTDPKIGITKSVQYALAKFDIIEPDLDKLVPFIGPPLIESFMEVYGLSETQAHQAVTYYREYFTKAGMYENAVYPGIIDMLTALAAKNKQLIIATSKPTMFSEQIAKHFGFYHFFEMIVGSNLDGSRIAKTEIIAYILSTMPIVNKQKIVMVGDRKHDIIGAKNNGLDAIAVMYGYGTAAELAQVKPKYMLKTVQQLKTLLLTSE